MVTSELGDLNLRSAAEQLADQLLALPDVTLVSLMGAKELEIAVEVDEQALRQFDISINQVAQAIRSSSINLSAGELRTDAGDLLLRTNQKRMSGTEFSNIVLRADPDGSILRLVTLRLFAMVLSTTLSFRRLMANQPAVKVEKSEEDALLIAGKIKAFCASSRLLGRMFKSG